MRRKHVTLSLMLLGMAGVLAVILLWQFIATFGGPGSEADEETVRRFQTIRVLVIWGVWNGLILLGAGLYLKLTTPEAMEEGRYRVFLLCIGALLGVGLLALAVGLPLKAWGGYFVPAAGAQETSALALWRANWWRLAIVGLSGLGGLGLMFASLQLGRSAERTSPGLRRLVYGYNAVLTGVLLFAILGLLNLLAYVPFPPFSLLDRQIDWTPSQLHTLGEPTQKLLEKELEGSVELIALMPVGDRLTNDIDQLVKNCTRYHKDITLSFVSPDLDRRDFVRLAQRYLQYFPANQVSDRSIAAGQLGLVVTYKSKDGKEDTVGIPYDELTERSMGGERRRYVFKGESQLKLALEKLAYKTPTKLYFTTGHGELDMTPPMAMGEVDPGLGRLKQRLESRGYYEFKSVNPETDSLVDADVLVIARPTKPFSTKAMEAIRGYLQPTGAGKKGKLIALLDVQVQAGKILETRLEGLLREFGVEAGSTRVLSRSPRPNLVPAVPNPDSKNPVAQAFGGLAGRYIVMQEPRPVSPVAGAPPSGIKADSLFVSLPGVKVWEEANLSASSRELLRTYEETKKGRELKDAVPVAVAVSESSSRTDLPMGHVPVGKEAPRMVVFGGADWVSDEGVGGPGGGTAVDLFASCVSWLQGRADLGADESAAKQRSEYTLQDKIKPNQVGWLMWLPLGLIFLTISALGGGIWLVRRR